MVQRPFVIRQETQVGLDISIANAAAPDCFGNGPDQAAVPQHERVNLDLKPAQGSMIQSHLGFLDGELRTERLVRALETDILHDQPRYQRRRRRENRRSRPRARRFSSNGFLTKSGGRPG